MIEEIPSCQRKGGIQKKNRHRLSEADGGRRQAYDNKPKGGIVVDEGRNLMAEKE